MPTLFKQMKPFVTHAGLRAALVAALTIPGIFLPTVARGDDQDLKKFSQFVQASNSASVKILREGRDLIDAEQWAQAAQKFNQFVQSYPKDKDVDVALYWLAYSLKKQGRSREALEPLKQLLKKYNTSSWADEGRAMLNEIAGELGDSKLAQKTLDRPNEDEEIKIVALQSLFEANPERGVNYVRDILKPGSTASPQLKEAAVSLLGSRGGPAAVPLLLELARNQTDPEMRARAIHSLGEEGGEAVLEDLVRLYDAERDEEVKRQILHSFSETESPRAHAKLVEVARNRSESEELRRSAIHWLGEQNASAFDDLSQIYAGEQNVEIKRQILHAFSEMNDRRATARLLEVARNASEPQELRQSAVHWLGERGDESAVDDLMKIYEASNEPDIRRQILHSFSEMENPRARAKLVEVARGGGDTELRQSAIHWLGEQDDAATLDTLIAMYDGEQNQDIKSQLLHAFSESKQKRALQKLMDVARRDPSIEMRKQAVHWLGESDDPDALKFLEDLLKP